MAKSEKIPKAKISTLGENLRIDADILEKLTKLQEDYQVRFKNRIEKAKQEALAGYKSRIEYLTKAKTESRDRYKEEITKYENMVKSLESEKTIAKTKPKKKA